MVRIAQFSLCVIVCINELFSSVIYNTPLVDGTSDPPVFSVDCFSASANDLKADSALYVEQSLEMRRISTKCSYVPVVIVFAF